MFYDYKLRPDALGILLKTTLIRHSAYVAAPFVVFVWFMLFEQNTFDHSFRLITIVLGSILFVGVFAATRYYTSGKAFRMISTDEHLEFTNLGNIQVKVRYTDITKIERTTENILFVYAQPNPDRPVIMISDTITDREYLESLLSHYSPIVAVGKLPFRYSSWYSALVTFAFLTLVLLQVLSHNELMVYLTGTVTLGFLVYASVQYYRYRKQVQSLMGIVALILLLLAVLVRMGIYALQHFQGYHI